VFLFLLRSALSIAPTFPNLSPSFLGIDAPTYSFPRAGKRSCALHHRAALLFLFRLNTPALLFSPFSNFVFSQIVAGFPFPPLFSGRLFCETVNDLGCFPPHPRQSDPCVSPSIIESNRIFCLKRRSSALSFLQLGRFCGFKLGTNASSLTSPFSK